jgi:GDPmannose 4,6-dehydratase
MPSRPPRALIAGITGQDGSYLAELLLSKGYEVHGTGRRFAAQNGPSRVDQHVNLTLSVDKLFLHYIDMNDPLAIVRLLQTIEPTEVYNLAGQSQVRASFDMPEYTTESVAIGTLRLLEALRTTHLEARFYQAGSCEMFGSSPPPQNEESVFQPRSPYGAAKLYAHWLTRQYREGYGIFACNGILFNHESPRRGEAFVTRKVTRGVAAIVAGTQKSLVMGNLSARRDWGYAPEYVEAMWRMLQQNAPDDYVIATGETHSVQELIEVAFSLVGMDWHEHVDFDARYLRPTEVEDLCGDASKAKAKLGWAPQVTFSKLVRILLEHDLQEAGVTPARVLKATVESA